MTTHIEHYADVRTDVVRTDARRVGREALRWFQAQPLWFQELIQRPTYDERLAEQRRAEFNAAQVALAAAANEIREGLRRSVASESIEPEFRRGGSD